MTNRHLRWLDRQLPQLLEKGIISEQTAAALRDHYRLSGKDTGLHTGVIIFGILGALLIGGGIILLIAYNWPALSRLQRTVIAFAPLILAHTLAGWSMATGRTRAVWREGTAVFMTLSVAAAIAIIGQTYNHPGNLADFLFTWMLLTAPIVYLLGSAGAGVIYFAGIAAWAGCAGHLGGQTILFWCLAALMMPFAAYLAVKERNAGRTALIGWAVSICLCIGAGLSLERVVPGVWIVLYAALFGTLYLVGAYWFDDAPSDWQKPYLITGAGGMAGLSLLLTERAPWEAVEWFRDPHLFAGPWYAGILNHLPVVVLSVAAIVLLATAVRRGKTDRVLYGSMPVLAIAGFLAAMGGWIPAWQVMAFNVYLFVLGAGTIAAGIRKNRMAVINGGMAVLTALILARFFDSDFGLAARGAAFIVVGIGFLGVNAVLYRKVRGAAHA